MKFSLRGASSVALLAGIVGGATAWAQEAPATVTTQQEVAPQAVDQIAPAAPEAEEPSDRVVVTGSLVGGASEDAPLPVETFNLEDLAEQGAPTAAEFLRSLTIASEASGEADSQIAGAAAGFANVNLRGLGASRTLVLLNGRRFASTDGGAGADINTLPTMAIGRIDVLKDGASVTYGAGAVGGVVNYITRKNFDGFEINVEKKMFDGSQGEDNIEALWGLTSDNSNMLFGASYGKRHRLGSIKRDFSTLPYQQQPAGWTVFDSNPGSYYLTTPTAPATTPSTTPVRDYTVDSCHAIGGMIGSELNNSLTAASINANDCAVWLPPYFNLIDEEKYTRAYFEYNSDFNDHQRFHFELAYAKTDNPNVQAGNSLPNGGKRATATNTFPAFANGAFTVPYTQPIYNAAGAVVGTSGANPYLVEFFNRARAGGRINPAVPYQNVLTHNQWRPLMFGPNSLYPGGHREEVQERERFGGSISLQGEFIKEGLFGQFLPEAMNTTYEFAATYSEYANYQSRPDWLISRLQDALRGYGGPGCGAVDRVATSFASAAAYDASVGIQSDTAPGTNGCEYFNPFASSFENSFISGGANPSYAGAGFENSTALLDWITHERQYEQTNRALTMDAVFTGEIPGVELPGGTIGWALGSQWRQVESRGTPVGSEDDIQSAGLDCPYGDQNLPATSPNQNACEAQSGPYFGSGIGRQFATFSDRQTISYFTELQIPVLDNLNFQVAARREEFGEIAGNIWKVAGKYDILPDLSFRASYSTNFQAPPDDLGVLGIQQSAVYVGSLLRSLPTSINTLDGITPEDDTGQNFGVIYAPELFGGQLRASVDFWQFVIDGEIANTSVTTALLNVFNTSAPGQATLANCSASFINLFDFATGPCQQGVTNASAITNVDQYTLNTGGFINNGLDYNIDYTHDLGPGEIFAGLSATQVLVYKVKGFEVPGVTNAQGGPLVYQGDYNGLGYANLTRAGSIMPEWRGNANLRYIVGDHNFGIRANYISGFVDESTPVRTGTNTNGTVTTADDTPIFATFGLDANDLWTFDLSYIYTAPFWQDLQFRASILNVADEDPMPAQNTNAGGSSATRTGYYPGYGDPRGRQFEIGVTKKF